jgi:hypothetical protein
MESQDEQRRIIDLELRQARYEASLAERRYAACDPDTRLIAAQLEKSWETALRRVEAYQARLEAAKAPDPTCAAPDFAALADDLNVVWNAPRVTMRARQQLLRTLIVDIIADIDEAACEVVLTIHWRGGQHSQLRLRKSKSGEHGCRTPDDALAVMRGMAGRWSDGRCHRNFLMASRGADLKDGLHAAVAARHVPNASSRRTRIVRREVKCRWVLNVDWPLAGTHRGHAGLRDFLQKASEAVETSFPEPPDTWRRETGFWSSASLRGES